ncbi:MAG: SpoIIE family protein phosphatase [Cyanobacteria bacterium REEB417]|nr:SpoIIE family protein phosphatase [Cyanobacteria bacterium REEB417]
MQLPLQRWKRQRLRQKLTLGVWLSIIPFTIAGSSLALWNAHNMVTRQWERRSLKDLELINGITTTWDKSTLDFLSYLADQDEINSLNPRAISRELRNSQKNSKYYNLLVFNTQGQLIANTRANQVGDQAHLPTPEVIRKEAWFQSAMTGVSKSWLTLYDTSDQAFAVSAVPIRPPNADRQSRPIGVLAAQIRLSRLDASSGIGSVFSATGNAQSNTDALIDLDQGLHKGIAAMLILAPGGVHFIGHPAMPEHYRKRMIDTEQTRQSRWWPVIEAALKPGATRETRVLNIDGTDFVLAIRRDPPARSAALLIDQDTKFRNVNTLFGWFWLVNLIALGLSSIAIHRISGALSQPVDQAGEALAAISQGNFDMKLPEESSDVGRLFNYINQASDQLKHYLQESTHHAITEAQLDQARRIQDDFLIKDLPNRREISLAASFDPAYEIGADWYDAIDLDDTVFFVVADVCDKGIPSALYMSVFRSLLRHNIINEFNDNNDPSTSILNALSGVNQYMAKTHGMTAMFATVFVGAYTVGTRQLSYIVAGHEAPLLLHNHQTEALSLGGPAVGLFHDCVFKAHHCRLEPGSILLAYSDGLPDARNPEGTAFGSERIRVILSERSSKDWTASELLQRLRQAALDHMDAGDQFDDLTLMTVKIESSG